MERWSYQSFVTLKKVSLTHSISSDGLEIFFIYPTWVKENCKKFSGKNTVWNMAKIQFEKYKNSKRSKNYEKRIEFIRISLEFRLELLTIDYDLKDFKSSFAISISKFWIFSTFSYFSKCILTMFQTVFGSENFLQFSLTHVG